MKRKIAMTYITSSFHKVWRCGYCDLQYIMKGTDAAYYNAGVYGWNCDIYIDYMHDVAITTGYRNMRGERIPDEVIDEFTERAKKVYEGYDWKSYDEYMEKMNQVRTDFYNRLAEIENERRASA